LDPYIDDNLFPRIPFFDHLQALQQHVCPSLGLPTFLFLSCFALFQRQHSCSTCLPASPDLLMQARNTKTLVPNSRLSQHRSPIHFISLLSPSTSTIIGLAHFHHISAIIHIIHNTVQTLAILFVWNITSIFSLLLSPSRTVSTPH